MFVVFEFQLDGSSNNKFMNGYTQNRSERNTGTALPDIVGEQSFKSRTNKQFFFVIINENLRLDSPQNATKPSTLNTKKPSENGLCVLGYEDVRSTPVHPKVRQELDYLDREV